MNKESVLQLLLCHLGEFRYHSGLLSELLELLANTGIEKYFFKQFIKRLSILARFGINAVVHEEFENIGQGIYSMHLSAKGYNIRVLYGFLPNSMPVLLLAFYERSGKRKTDYSLHLSPAKNRLQEEGERFNNEH